MNSGLPKFCANIWTHYILKFVFKQFLNLKISYWDIKDLRKLNLDKFGLWHLHAQALDMVVVLCETRRALGHSKLKCITTTGYGN